MDYRKIWVKFEFQMVGMVALTLLVYAAYYLLKR
jgi:hypothetical protein